MNESGGCDYTIACGQKLVNLRATNIDEANKEAYQILEDHGFDRIQTCEILEVSSVTVIDIDELIRKIEEDESKRLADINEEKEKQEYERLKNKFENN